MGKIDDVQARVQAAGYFNYLSERPNYLRILDTPHAWGAPFGRGIMPAALASQAAFERVVLEILHKGRYRCDVASLNSTVRTGRSAGVSAWRVAAPWATIQ